MLSLRRAAIGRRLGTAFGAVSLLVLLSGVIGFVSSQTARGYGERIAAAETVARDAETARFQIADLTGWQGLVFSDAMVYGPDVALAPDAYNRSGMLESKDAVYAWLDELDTSGMTPEEAAAFAGRRAAWGDLVAWGAKVVDWRAAGTPGIGPPSMLTATTWMPWRA